jgi:hypothetical protein
MRESASPFHFGGLFVSRFFRIAMTVALTAQNTNEQNAATNSQ